MKVGSFFIVCRFLVFLSCLFGMFLFAEVNMHESLSREKFKLLNQLKVPGGDYVPLDTSPLFTVDKSEEEFLKGADLNSIVERVRFLKEEVFKSRSKSLVMEELNRKRDAFSGVSWLDLEHVDRMDKNYKLLSLAYYIDEKKIYFAVEPFKKEDAGRVLKIFDTIVEPGPHKLIVYAVYSGDQKGLFSYVNSYQIKISREYPFEALLNQRVNLKVVSKISEKFFVGFEDRLRLEFFRRDSALALNFQEEVKN